VGRNPRDGGAVIYGSPGVAAGRLVAALKPLLAKAEPGRWDALDRDAAVVLRRIEEAAREARGSRSENQVPPRPRHDRARRGGAAITGGNA
jgi:hypothetical protein